MQLYSVHNSEQKQLEETEKLEGGLDIIWSLLAEARDKIVTVVEFPNNMICFVLHRIYLDRVFSMRDDSINSRIVTLSILELGFMVSRYCDPFPRNVMLRVDYSSF